MAWRDFLQQPAQTNTQQASSGGWRRFLTGGTDQPFSGYGGLQAAPAQTEAPSFGTTPIQEFLGFEDYQPPAAEQDSYAMLEQQVAEAGQPPQEPAETREQIISRYRNAWITKYPDLTDFLDQLEADETLDAKAIEREFLYAVGRYKQEQEQQKEQTKLAEKAAKDEERRYEKFMRDQQRAEEKAAQERQRKIQRVQQQEQKAVDAQLKADTEIQKEQIKVGAAEKPSALTENRKATIERIGQRDPFLAQLYTARYEAEDAGDDAKMAELDAAIVRQRERALAIAAAEDANEVEAIKQQALADIIGVLRGAAAGLTLGASNFAFGAALGEEGTRDVAEAQSQFGKIAETGTQLATGFGAAGAAIKGATAALPAATTVGGAVAQRAAVQAGVGAVQSINNSVSAVLTGQMDKDEAKANIAAGILSSGLAAPVAAAVPGKLKNAVAQVATDLMVDLASDAAFTDYLQDQGFVDWFLTRELPNLVVSAAGAGLDLKGAYQQKQEIRKLIREGLTRTINLDKGGGIPRGPEAEAAPEPISIERPPAPAPEAAQPPREPISIERPPAKSAPSEVEAEIARMREARIREAQRAEEPVPAPAKPKLKVGDIVEKPGAYSGADQYFVVERVNADGTIDLYTPGSNRIMQNVSTEPSRTGPYGRQMTEWTVVPENQIPARVKENKRVQSVQQAARQEAVEQTSEAATAGDTVTIDGVTYFADRAGRWFNTKSGVEVKSKKRIRDIEEYIRMRGEGPSPEVREQNILEAESQERALIAESAGEYEQRVRREQEELRKQREAQMQAEEVIRRREEARAPKPEEEELEPPQIIRPDTAEPVIVADPLRYANPRVALESLLGQRDAIIKTLDKEKNEVLRRRLNQQLQEINERIARGRERITYGEPQKETSIKGKDIKLPLLERAEESDPMFTRKMTGPQFVTEQGIEVAGMTTPGAGPERVPITASIGGQRYEKRDGKWFNIESGVEVKTKRRIEELENALQERETTQVPVGEGAEGRPPMGEEVRVEATPVEQAKKEISVADSVVELAKSVEEGSKKRIKDLLDPRNLGANKPVGLAVEAVIYGSARITRGVVEFGQWSAEMVREFGEAIRPYLRDIYSKSVAVSKKNLGSPEAIRAEAETNIGRLAIDSSAFKKPEAAAPTPKPEAPTTGEAGAVARGLEDAPPIEQAKPLPGVTKSSGSVGPAKQRQSVAVQPSSDPDVIEVSKALDRQQKDFERAMQAKGKRATDSIAEGLWDNQALAKRKVLAAELKEAEARLILRRGWAAEASAQYDDSLKKIDRLITHTNERTFSEYLEMRRLVEVSDLKAERAQDYDLPYGITPEQAKKWVAEFESQKAAEGTLDTYKAAANEYYAASKRQLDQLLDEGLISKEAHASLVENHKNYSPQQMIQYLDPDDTSGLVGKGAGPPIKALKGGSESGRVIDYRYLMARTIASSQSRIFNNRANKALVLGMNEKAAKELGAILDDGSYERVPFGYERIKAYENGQEKSIFVPREFAESWNGSDPVLKSNAAKIMRLVSMSSAVKAQATGYNPEFILSNFPRDLAFSYLNTKEYNPILPVGALQQATDLAQTFKDAWKKTGKYRDYLKEGGGLDGLAKEGRLDKNPWEKVTPTSETVNAIGKFLGAAGEFSERWVRLAVYNRAIKNGKSPMEAAKVARDMLDFAQGGSFTKTADVFVPYLNAATQGTRALFRDVDAEKLFKAGQIMSIGAAFEAVNSAYNEEAWSAISDQEKATKWIIPLDKYTDEDGKQRFRYIAIAKDQGAALLSAMGAAASQKAQGKDVNKDEIVNSIKNAFPDTGLLMSPLAEAGMAYFNNFDMFRMEDIYKGRPTTPSTEFSGVEPIDKVAEKLSELSGGAVEISPIRAKRAIEKVVLPHNPITMGTLIGARALVGEENFGEMIKALIDEKPGIRRFIRSTPPTEIPSAVAEKAERLGVETEGKAGKAVRQEVYEAEQQVGAERNRQDREIRRIMTRIKKNEATKQELIDYIRQFPDDYTRLRNRIKTIQEEFGLQLYIPPARTRGGGLGGDLGGSLGGGSLGGRL